MQPIIYNGEEYKDRFVATTPIKPSLKMRLEFLFCSSISVEHEVFTKEIMPREKTICHFTILSWWDRLRSWNYQRKNKGGWEAPSEKCNTTSPQL